jgi:hypothetical protein
MEKTMTTPTHTCYTVRDRGEGKKAFWAIIGSAWVNKDQSLTLRLDSLPLDGEIVVRLRKSDDAGRTAVDQATA